LPFERSTVELVAEGIVGRGSFDIRGRRGDGILKISRRLEMTGERLCGTGIYSWKLAEAANVTVVEPIARQCGGY